MRIHPKHDLIVSSHSNRTLRSQLSLIAENIKIDNYTVREIHHRGTLRYTRGLTVPPPTHYNQRIAILGKLLTMAEVGAKQKLSTTLHHKKSPSISKNTFFNWKVASLSSANHP